ncbi:MAG TPA: hypothetical protein DCE42_14600 [Myxococcales bacterium]|nr:hypothetical protein [Deltaproteobacteria bacterium]HAA55991.1 hypothetical protein [Myxococcales bacterium]
MFLFAFFEIGSLDFWVVFHYTQSPVCESASDDDVMISIHGRYVNRCGMFSKQSFLRFTAGLLVFFDLFLCNVEVFSRFSFDTLPSCRLWCHSSNKHKGQWSLFTYVCYLLYSNASIKHEDLSHDGKSFSILWFVGFGVGFVCRWM